MNKIMSVTAIVSFYALSSFSHDVSQPETSLIPVVPNCLSEPSVVPGAYVISFNRVDMDPTLISNLMAQLGHLEYLRQINVHYQGDWIHVSMYAPAVSYMPPYVLQWHVEHDLAFLDTGCSVTITCVAKI